MHFWRQMMESTAFGIAPKGRRTFALSSACPPSISTSTLGKTSTASSSLDESDRVTNPCRVKSFNYGKPFVCSRHITSTSDERTLEEVLAVHGKHHVRGLGTNIASKVLTVHDRKLWPLFNHRVKKTFEQYGYRVDWGANHYLAFAAAMRRVLARQGQPDFWAMDVFCEWRSRDV
jgi:hypothetical protein